GDVETCLAVGEVKAASPSSNGVPGTGLEEAWCSGMIFRGAGPKDAELLLDAFVGDAGIIGDPARRGAPQFREDFTRIGERESSLASQRRRDVLHDAPVLTGIAGRIHALVDLDNPAFNLCDGALVLLVQRSRQHDLGMMGGFAEEEI